MLPRLFSASGIYVVRCLLLWCIIISGSAPTGRAELPAKESTEQWEPVPEIVSVPADGPPADAVVLFDGRSLAAWQTLDGKQAAWRIDAGAVLTVVPRAGTIRTAESFGSVQLHLEFRSPAEINAAGQDRGNSGILFMGLYELQILDSYQNATYVNGQAAAVYKQFPPLVNASRPPGEWQVLDVIFIAPRFDDNEVLLSPARMTAFHNGVLVHHDVILSGPTRNRGQPAYAAHAAELPLQLQDHRTPVSFRNIWIRRLEPHHMVESTDRY